jgi:hypothetical protein
VKKVTKFCRVPEKLSRGVLCRGLYIGKISADVIWGKKYEKAKRKRGKCKRKRKKGERK